MSSLGFSSCLKSAQLAKRLYFQNLQCKKVVFTEKGVNMFTGKGGNFDRKKERGKYVDRKKEVDILSGKGR